MIQHGKVWQDLEVLLYAQEAALESYQGEDPLLREASEALEALERTASVREARRFARVSHRWMHHALNTVLSEDVPEGLLILAHRAAFEAILTRVGGLGSEVALLPIYVEVLRDIVRKVGVDVEPLHKSVHSSLSSVSTRQRAILRTVFDELMSIEQAESELARIQSILGLNKTETGDLFGISRQAITGWQERGVPNERVADVSRIAELAERLYEHLNPERIPQIVRTEADGLEGRTILEVLRTEGPDRVHGYLDDLFAYQPA